MIGKICTFHMPYYDIKSRKMLIKARPALVIGYADKTDLTVLPVSKVSDQRRIHPKYDIKVDPSLYPKSNLSCVSYIRTHKVYTVNSQELNVIVCDLKAEYDEIYLRALCLFEEYTKKLLEQI